MPVGLPISANSPAEIAISILGEIISVKNQSGFDITYEKPVAKALFEKMLPGEKQPFLGGVLVSVQHHAA